MIIKFNILWYNIDMNNNKCRYKDDILKICKKQHFTAEDILARINKKYSGIGQATIYRAIKKLTIEGLLNKISLHNKSYYEMCEQFHGHLINKDNKIKDFSISNEFIKEIEKKVGQKIKGLDLKVFTK